LGEGGGVEYWGWNLIQLWGLGRIFTYGGGDIHRKNTEGKRGNLSSLKRAKKQVVYRLNQ